ncbi:MAG: hypothetical protein J6386_02610 [Candidatus Synoicihabitans palmerolidicus]|nr:hypothetical protein [Candidatus Synoicihabitans palmerolidicus]
MATGTDWSVALMQKIAHFNGGLFDHTTALPLSAAQISVLLEAAKPDWSDVEPAIFGTLLERALSPRDRHKLGAHYTPRSYVERLVKPTIIDPLRARWDNVRIAAAQHQAAGDTPVAIAQLVLWIGYFQWHKKTTGQSDTGDRPLLPKEQTIRAQDAVLAYDAELPRKDAAGNFVTI